MKNFLCIFFFVISAAVQADNLRIHGGVKIIPVSADGVGVEVNVSWANSWRNAYNYDAVYIFGKFSTEDAPEWEHIYFDTDAAAHEVTEGYAVKVINGGRGVLVFRLAEQQGTASATLRLRWKIDGNTDHPVGRPLFDENKVRVSVHGLEMVYVPSGPFYAGDGLSANSFSNDDFGILPAAYDIIGTSSNFTYSGNGSETAAAYVNRPADRYDQGQYNAANRHDWCGTVMPAWWQVDFKTPKTIRYFGVSGLCWEEYPPAPAGDWYLEGSADAKTWTDLWHGGTEFWGKSPTSYPVQRAIRVDRPGAYRYYRIRVTDNQRPGLWNDIRIANVAMAEADLDSLSRKQAVLQDGFHRILPVKYPLGTEGFYAMKYELTQEQYVVFLNQLPRPAQYTRTIGGALDGLKAGDYIFGNTPSRPSYRNGIILLEHPLNGTGPYVFACNLNPGSNPGNTDDGQAVACNYLSPADMLAYADWCGLRPLSELEYEKMCRGYYPGRPAGGELAWETTAVAGFTEVVSGGYADERAKEPGANVNMGGGAGPARVGMFVRPGNRIQAGNSFWGISDLSGNLSEIYCNAEVYGRQFDGSAHGRGSLNMNGTATTGRASWPWEADAYGIRGGDFSSSLSESAVSYRDSVSGYFGDLQERRPNVGIRLGMTAGTSRVSSELTLENGLKSGSAVVYDTVCDASDYMIRGDRPEAGKICQYLWLGSTDQGETWQTVKGGNEKDLRLGGLTEQVRANDVRQFLFKRLYYSADRVSESGVVAIVVTHGFRVDRLKDTLQPCMVSAGFTVSTILPALYEWRCVDNGKILKTSEQKEENSHYDLLTSDFVVEDKRPCGLYTLEVKITQAGGCTLHQKLEVEVLPYTCNPFSSDVETFVYSSDGQQVTNIWGGSDSQVWTIVNEEKGSLEVSDRGIISGLSSTMCRHIVVEAVCKAFPDKVYRKEMHEPQRTLNYTAANYYTLNLLSGNYLMECWGARGGTACQDWSTTAYGGLGGYASGELELGAVTPLYLYVGGYGGGNGAGPGWNGGGQGGANNDGEPGGSGGGASDIRLIPGNLFSRIIVAGGGGGAGNYSTGPAGGGLSGGQVSAAPGTQVSGYAFGYGGTGGRDSNGNSGGGGGGGGYYGGAGAGTNAGGGGGGSGFVSGMEGCNAVTETGTHTGQPDHYSGFIFKNPTMNSGVRDGHGMIKITVK